MTGYEWVVCERSGRWAAALRTAFARHPATLANGLALREARSLDEAHKLLDADPCQLVMIEVTAENLESVLAWLSEALPSTPATLAIALLSGDLGHEAIDALLEAGAAEIANSPRRLQHVLALGRQHAARNALAAEKRPRHEAFADWSWAQLPWQAAPTRIG